MKFTDFNPLTPAHAFAWTRLLPAIQRSQNGWDSGFACPENVVKDGNRYYCVYEGRTDGATVGVGIAYSDDLRSWTKYPQILNNVLSGSPHLHHEPTDGNWYIFAAPGQMSGIPFATIHLYKSTTGVGGPYSDLGIVLNVGPSGNWDQAAVLEPFLVKTGHTYFLFYMGEGSTDTSFNREQIGLATAFNIEGPYTKYGQDGLVLGFNLNPDAWDSALEADPWIYPTSGDPFADGYYYLGYAGGGRDGNGGGSYEWKTGLARSRSLYGPWERCPSNPVCQSRGFSGFSDPFQDGRRIWRGSMFDDGAGNKYLMYGGRVKWGANGYLASVDSFPPNFNVPTQSWSKIDPTSTPLNPKLTTTSGWHITELPGACYNRILYSNIPDEKMILRFFGSGVRIRGRLYPAYGKAGVTLDSGQEIVVDCYSDEDILGVMLFAAEGLATGWHTLQVRILNENTPPSTGNYVGIDLLEVLF